MNNNIMSPSMYSAWTKCPRKAMIEADRFLGNIHTVYGRAFEDGCKVLIDLMVEYQSEDGYVYNLMKDEYEWPESDDKAREYICGLALMKSSRYLLKFDGRPHKEKNVFTLALGLQEIYAWLNEFLTTHKVEQFEERIIFEAPNFTIGGAYDFMAQKNYTQTSNVYDFKGITSLWNYSFPSSPQIPIYTVLKQMALIASGSDKIMSMNGGYLINMTSAKKEENPYLYIPVNSRLVLANLENMMADFIDKAKQLHLLQSQNNNTLSRYENAGVGLNHCNANFNCYHIHECETKNFSLQVNPDDRVFDKLTKYQFSDNLLQAAINKIRANSSTVNLVDGDTIAKGSSFDPDALDEALGITQGPIEFELGEL